MRSGDKEIIEGAKAIAEDMKLPGGGRAKLARIIDRHLDWFDIARARGFEWSDIVMMLFNAGVARPDGRPLSRGHVSSLVWRRRAETQKRGGADKAPASLITTRSSNEAASDSRGKHVPREQAESMLPKAKPSSAGHGSATARNLSAGSSKKNEDVLAFMKRAAAIRKQ